MFPCWFCRIPHMNYSIALLKKIDYFYLKADLETKQQLIGSIFPEKVVYDDGNYRTNRIHEVIRLTCSNTNVFGLSQTGLKDNSVSQPLKVSGQGLEPSTSVLLSCYDQLFRCCDLII